MAKQILKKTYKTNSKFQEQGFTLIELLIVIAILGVTAYFGTSYLASYQTGASLDSATENISSYLQQARSKSMAQEQGKAYGVKFDSDGEGDFYQLCPEIGDCQPKIYLPSEITFKSFTPPKQIQFTKLYGSLSDDSSINGIRLISSKLETLNIVYVNEEGKIYTKKRVVDCDALTGWHWYDTNNRPACWSKTLADSVSWNKGVGDDTDNPGAYTCATDVTALKDRMVAVAAGQWYKIVESVGGHTMLTDGTEDGQNGAQYISALAIADCVDGTRDLCTGDGCTGATDWSSCNTYYRTWASATGKSALPYLATDAGTLQTDNDYWDACVQSGTQDQTLGCTSGTNYFYWNRKSCGNDYNYSWAAACGRSTDAYWDTYARLPGVNNCENQDAVSTSYAGNTMSFRVVVRP